MKPAIEIALYYALSTVVLFTIIAVLKWHEYAKAKKLRDLVGWILTGADGAPLFYTITEVQSKLKIPKDHLLAESDKDLTDAILNEFKKDLVLCYFQGNLSLIRSKHHISNSAYFIFTFYNFLRKHQNDYRFLGYDMHAKMVAQKPLDSSIIAGYETVYALTDFAIVFYKLFYTTYVFCKDSKISNPDGDRFNNDQYIKKILDTKQLTVSRY